MWDQVIVLIDRIGLCLCMYVCARVVCLCCVLCVCVSVRVYACCVLCVCVFVCLVFIIEDLDQVHILVDACKDC